MMNRRGLLKGLGVGLSGMALSGWRQGKAIATPWGYSGATSPEHWAELDPDFQVCQRGTTQSPVNLSETKTTGEGLTLDYQDSSIRLVNNGLTLRVDCQPGSFLRLDDQTFELLQFHFHAPSEHQLAGKSYDMELHLVHRSPAGNLAVIGVLITPGAKNPLIQKIWDEIPNKLDQEKALPDVKINAERLLPQSRQFYRYLGSLTTPPCSEGVEWIVMQEAIALSSQQIEQFHKVFRPNARPIQQQL